MGARARRYLRRDRLWLRFRARPRPQLRGPCPHLRERTRGPRRAEMDTALQLPALHVERQGRVTARCTVRVEIGGAVNYAPDYSIPGMAEAVEREVRLGELADLPAGNSSLM